MSSDFPQPDWNTQMPAVINVTINPAQFVDITSVTSLPRGNLSLYTPANLDSPLLCFGQGQGTVTVTDGSIQVSGGAVWVDLVFDQTWNNQHPQNQRSWRPVGIAFKSTGNDRGDTDLPMDAVQMLPAGYIFPGDPTQTPRTGASLRIYDSKADLTTWEFYIIVQKQDGAIGIIDPDLENQN